MDWQSWLIYSFILFATTLCLYCDKKAKGTNFFYICGFIIITSFCAFRYKVGFDYEGYINIYEDIYYDLISYVEPGYFLLNKMFVPNHYGYLFVLAIMSFFSLFLLFQVFKHYNILLYGIFFLITFQLLFMINNQVRQGLSLAIFMYAIQYIETKRYLKYVISILIAAMFHTTALILLFVPFLQHIRIQRWTWILLIICSLGGYFIGIFDTIIGKIFDWLPIYVKYLGTNRTEVEATTHPLIVCFWSFILLFVAYNGRDYQDKIIYKISMLGATLYPIFVNYHLFNRLNLYLLYCFIPMLAIEASRNSRIKIISLIIAYIFFSIYCLKNWGLDGGYPYNSIISQTPIRIS